MSMLSSHVPTKLPQILSGPTVLVSFSFWKAHSLHLWCFVSAACLCLIPLPPTCHSGNSSSSCRFQLKSHFLKEGLPDPLDWVTSGSCGAFHPYLSWSSHHMCGSTCPASIFFTLQAWDCVCIPIAQYEARG